MRILLNSAVTVMCCATPSFAETPESLPQPDFVIPFDEIDEADLQTEISTQVATFLQTVHSHQGKDKAALRTSVTGEARDDQSKLIYLRNIGDHGVLEGYEFNLDTLARGQYILLQRPLNRLNEFIGYYLTVKQTLTDTYGAPADDQVIWDNDLYQPLPDYWGVAVMIGHLRYHAAWDIPDGTVTLELTGERHSRLSVDYRIRHAGALT
ncbi:MAG: hypothetical protein P0111_17425 [Nitrospira sp.]|nr:hypothetical protein [Nitrospira sp.]